ncbi:MAG TPA: tRNA (adenosine(37)-N6)-threonylcarbamoyltransferase complex dimerization subunit type 1 TsaB [Planctomycetota bacterium]|nr:tRNA (adenosine(37)-N6)-threonylcarbamoyltransferase complex dimerization subunit type 1 TsaB [Planctomycetota bacterium]
MLSAAFETSTRSPSVALAIEGEILEERLSGARPHASDLLPALDRLLSKSGHGVGELGLIVVGTGPGSFTGLRVAVATALGLARGTGAALFGLPSWEALCWRELEPGAEAAVVQDARGGSLYFAHYRREVDGVLALRAPCLIQPSELEALVPTRLRLFAESGIEQLAQRSPDALAQLSVDRSPYASALLELGLLRHRLEGPHTPAQLEPLYLRAFASPPKPRSASK